MLSTHIEKSGETQAAWAERFGISAGHLSLILSGQKLPSLRLAFRIEAATGGGVPVSSWSVPAAPPHSPESAGEDAA